jgi:hypothetical protein
MKSAEQTIVENYIVLLNIQAVIIPLEIELHFLTLIKKSWIEYIHLYRLSLVTFALFTIHSLLDYFIPKVYYGEEGKVIRILQFRDA